MANPGVRCGLRGLVRGLVRGLALGLVLQSPVASGQEDKEADKGGELTLERIFPEKGFFGPSARSMAFSHDGRFAAFLYRPWIERRHGSDLYVMDTQTGTIRRVTSAGRMGEFQEDARKVREDREKRAKKSGVTIEDLAIEQHARHGWALPGVIGRWSGTGEGVGRGAPIASGEATLDVRTGKELSGTLRIGLAAFDVSKGAFDAEAGTLSAGVRGVGEVEGTLSLTLKGGELSGTVTLTKPEGSARLTLTRETDSDEGEGSEGEHRAVGVIGAWGERLSLGDVVLEDDAEINDEDKEGNRPKDQAPRYGGVSGFEFSPTGDEMLIDVGGDVYRLEIDRGAWEGELAAPEALEVVTPDLGRLTRLTRTAEREGNVAYLPDGSGFTYLRDGALMIVRFGEHAIVQLDPRLEDGERMSAYRLSPDMKRVVFLGARGESFWGRGRQVTIVNYRERFARATQVTRHMPDDPWPEAWSSIYLYDLEGHDREEGTLRRVFTRRLSGPRDVMALPEWSMDSSRVAFSAYDQASGNVMILEAGFEDGEDGESGEEGAEEADPGEDEAEGEETEEGEEPGTEDGEKEEKADFEIFDAKVVYRFLHFGGPNTPGMVQPVYLSDNRRMAFIAELSGYRQLHVLDPVYERMTQLTEGAFEVYPIEVSEDHTTMFVSATRDDPNQEHIFRVDLATGEMTRLSETEGRYTGAAVRDDGSMVLANFVDFGAPGELALVTPGENGPMRVLTDSHPGEAHALTGVSPEYFSYENRHGQTIHGHMFKPADWTPQDRRPLLIYVYGGPLGESKMAHRGSYAAPSYFFARYMTERHGWVTATIDPRGASGYGAVFEKANFERVGKPQTEDLVDGARWLVEHGGVDKARMALHGWSFGGFQTQMVMYTEPEEFAAGIAGAGPTEWHNYNSWYSTGTIGENEAGKTSLEKFSLLPLAKNLKGRLLLVHGVEDSNVLFQDTMRVYRELLKADKEVLVELFLDPTGGHGLGGDVQTINRYRKYEDFLLRYLGKGEAGEGGGAKDGAGEVGKDGEI